MPPLCRAEVDGPAPLSVPQERLWSLEQSEPGAAYYHIPLTWDIEGELHFEALQESFRLLAQRHEALRTTFPATESGPMIVRFSRGQLAATSSVLNIDTAELLVATSIAVGPSGLSPQRSTQSALTASPRRCPTCSELR